MSSATQTKTMQQSIIKEPIKPLTPITSPTVTPNQSIPPKPLQPTVIQTPESPTIQPEIPVQDPNKPPTPEVPKTGNEQVDANLKTLAEQAGAAGMTLDQYLALAAKQNQPTKQESDAIRNNLGIPDLVDKAYAQPKNTTVQMYTDLYDLSGLSDTKDKIKELDKSIAQKRDDFVKATGELYNNPWLSQATRSGRLGNLQRIAMADIDNVLNQKQQYLDLYDKGITEIESQIKRSVYDTGVEKDLTVDKLNYLLTEAERDQDFAQRAIQQRALRYLPDYLSNKPQTSKEDFTLKEGEVRYDAQGNVIASYKPDTSTQDAETQRVLQEKVTLIDSLLSGGGLEGSVGTGAYDRWTPFTADKAQRQNFAAGVNQLVNQETINTLLNLKSQGGTLGALSDQERVLLQSAATKIGTWIDRDENGKPTGVFNVDRQIFKDELNKLKSTAEAAIQRAGGTVKPKTLDEYYKNADEKERTRIDGLIKNEGLNEQEVMKLLGFNTESQTSLKGNTQIQKIANAIGQYESGGDYTKRGPTVTSGIYKGERAMGKHQIMPSNLPKWSKEAVGRVVTEKEFMSNPKLQDQIAQYQMDKIYQKYGTVEDTASVWFTGQPLNKAGNAKDVLGTTAPKYVRNVMAIYNKNA
jgi:hypothetical protein